jgi:hypothetical protein
MTRIPIRKGNLRAYLARYDAEIVKQLTQLGWLVLIPSEPTT